MTDGFRFHHLGILTSSLIKTRASYSSLGIDFGSCINDPRQRVSLAFSVASSPLIELVEPWPEGKVANLLQSRGVGPYHTCYEVESIAHAASVLRRSRWMCVTNETPAVAFGNRNVAFFVNPHCGIIELLEAE